MTAEMVLNPVTNLPQAVLDDVHSFIAKLDEEPFDDNSLKIYRTFDRTDCGKIGKNL